MNYELWIMNYELWIMNFPARNKKKAKKLQNKWLTNEKKSASIFVIKIGR